MSKNVKKVFWNESLEIPVVIESDVTYSKRFNLIATINHSGNLRHSHYTAYIKCPLSSKWFHCNGSAVILTSEAAVNNTSSYICFYQAG